MKTKDEIWDSFMGKGDFATLSTHQKSLVKGILGEYAKQQAIEFDKWKRVNGYTIDEHGDYIKLVIDGEFARTEWRPADEVYNQFIESQNK